MSDPKDSWYAPKDPTPREACPCCGYVTLAERGMCQICRVCFREDDPFTRDAHHVYSMPNHMTLAEARKNYATVGASKSKWIGHVLPFAALAEIEHRPVELTDPFPPREQCPCCGYVSLPTLGEHWECAVCQWTDMGEPLHVTHTCERTLWMARARFARRGIVDERFERRPFVERDDRSPTHPCACCDYVTLVDRGAELLCPLCLWFDDPAATARDVHSVPNESTLAHARARFAVGLKNAEEEWYGRVDPEDCAMFERRPLP